MQPSNKFGGIGQRQYTPLSLWDNPPQAPSMPTKQYTPAEQPSTNEFEEVYDPWNTNPASYSSLYHDHKEEENTDEEETADEDTEQADEDTEQADEEGGDDEGVEEEKTEPEKDDEEEETDEDQKEAEKNAAGIYTPPIDHYYLDLFKGTEAELDPWGAPLPIPTYTKKNETSTDFYDFSNSTSNSNSTEHNTEDSTEDNTEENTENTEPEKEDEGDEETSTSEEKDTKEDTVSSLFHKVNDKIDNIAGGIHKDIEEYKPTNSTSSVSLDDYGYHYTSDDKLTALMDRVTALESAALIESFFTVNEEEVEIPEK